MSSSLNDSTGSVTCVAIAFRPVLEMLGVPKSRAISIRPTPAKKNKLLTVGPFTPWFRFRTCRGNRATGLAPSVVRACPGCPCPNTNGVVTLTWKNVPPISLLAKISLNYAVAQRRTTSNTAFTLGKNRMAQSRLATRKACQGSKARPRSP